MHQFAEPAQFDKPKRRRKRARRRRMLVGAVAVLLVGTMLGVGLILTSPPAGNGGGETAGPITDTGGTGGQSSMIIPGEGDSGQETVVKQGDPSKTDGDPEQPVVTQEEPKGLVQDLQDEVKELRDSLALEQEKAGELDRELAKRGKQIKEIETEKKNFQKQMDALNADLDKTKAGSTKREQQLTDELNGARENLVKVQASYEESRAKLIDLREKFDLKERQYQARMTSLENNVARSGTTSTQMVKLLETQRDQIHGLQNQLDRQQKTMATKYLVQARDHIMKMSERGSEEHLESALQQLYFAGKVDPNNNRKYRQMAVELLDEQVERLRQRKGKKSADKDKRYQHFMSLRAKLVDDQANL
jgi:chromosome segregation ATPase